MSLGYLYPELVVEWSEKNKISPYEITPSSGKKFWWKCPNCRREWQCNADNRTKKKTGCSLCSSSRGENRIKEYLDKIQIEYEYQKSFEECRTKEALSFDFYIKRKNVVIEYQGIQHYKPVDFAGKGEEWAKEQFQKLKARDKIKKTYCKNNNICMIRISYLNFENIEKILIRKGIL